MFLLVLTVFYPHHSQDRNLSFDVFGVVEFELHIYHFLNKIIETQPVFD